MKAPEAGDPSKFESGSTTQLSVMDKDGNMVTVTKTINDFFASGVVVPGTGIVMGDDMNDFDLKPGSANSIPPGERMLSSMSPALVLDPQGRPFMALGSPGANRIIPALSQVISHVIDRSCRRGTSGRWHGFHGGQDRPVVCWRLRGGRSRRHGDEHQPADQRANPQGATFCHRTALRLILCCP
jgi:hypothetical protein